MSPLRQQHLANAACSHYPPKKKKKKTCTVGLSVYNLAINLVVELIGESISVSISESIGEKLSESVDAGDAVGGSTSNCQKKKKQNKVCNINFCCIFLSLK